MSDLRSVGAHHGVHCDRPSQGDPTDNRPRSVDGLGEAVARISLFSSAEH
jgi:hypothetical protein